MASGQERRAVTLQSNETWNLQAHIGGKTKTTDTEKKKTKSSLRELVFHIVSKADHVFNF